MSKESEHEYVAFFKKNLVEHLKAPSTGDIPKNQPAHVLMGAKTSIGTLSRIFDEFKFPLPDYSEIEKDIEAAGRVRLYMQGVIDAISPLILNEDKNALNEAVIEAIGRDTYDAFLQKSSKKEVASQFIQAIGISYAQRVLDNAPADIGTGVYQNFMTPVNDMFKHADVTGLRKPMGEDLSLEDVKKRLDACKEQFILFPKNEARACWNLVDEGETLLSGDLVSGASQMKDETKKSALLTIYNKLADKILSKMLSTNVSEPQQPKPRSRFIQKLREIGGDKALQQNDEERKFSNYNKLKANLARYVDKADTTRENQVLKAKVVLAGDIKKIGKYRIKLGGANDSEMDKFIIEKTTEMKGVNNMQEARALKNELDSTLDNLKAGKKVEKVIEKLLSKTRPGMRKTRVGVGQAMANKPLHERHLVSKEVEDKLNRHRVSPQLSRHSDTKTFRKFKQEMERIKPTEESKVKKEKHDPVEPSRRNTSL